MHSDCVVIVMAKAPVPGYAKTRLIPTLGAAAAARLHREMTLHALREASAADIGELTLWCAPDCQHRFFRALKKSNLFGKPLAFAQQVEGDLGRRMAAVFAAANGPMLLIGSDCPALSVEHLHQAATALTDGFDAVFIPAEDGGYTLVGLRRPLPTIFAGITWGSQRVMAQTRERLKQADLRWLELATLWDVDTPEDVLRWRALQREKCPQSDTPEI